MGDSNPQPLTLVAHTLSSELIKEIPNSEASSGDFVTSRVLFSGVQYEPKQTANFSSSI